MLTPESCPKFDKCSANICPLDHHWRQRTHLKGERVCFYLRKHAKNDLRGDFGGRYPAGFTKKVAQEYPRIISHFSDIKRQCDRSASITKKPERGLAA